MQTKEQRRRERTRKRILWNRKIQIINTQSSISTINKLERLKHREQEHPQSIIQLARESKTDVVVFC